MPYLVRDAVRLAYEESGAGDPTLIFIHGWTCNRTHFAPQVERFAPNHRCLSIDLRGHGQSDAPEQEYTVTAFADDAAWLCGQLGVKRGVIIGHSMGGAIALALAQARPDLAAGVVLLDPAILYPTELKPLIPALAQAFRADDGAATLRQFITDRFFITSSPPALRQRITAELMSTPMHVTCSAFDSIPGFDAEAALTSFEAPVMYVGAEPAMADIATLRMLRPDVMLAQTSDAGHFLQLEAPDQVNTLIACLLERVL